MPRPNRPTNLDRLLDLKGKMDNDVATTSDVVEVIIAEMDAEGKKGDNLARIMKALDRSIPWVYRHYQLRHLADRLKPLIDEMGTSVAVEISTAPDSDQWNIWQQVQQEEKPRKRAKLAQRLAKKSKASVLEEKPACAPQRKGKREKKGTGELSAREQEVVALREQGKARKEIGDALGISVQTVGKHLQNIRKKLGAPPRTRKETRRGTTVENAARPAGTETGVEAINRLVQTLGTVDMNSDVTDGSFLDFASGQTPSNMQRILERGEVIKNAIERIRTAYKKVSLPLLKDN